MPRPLPLVARADAVGAVYATGSQSSMAVSATTLIEGVMLQVRFERGTTDKAPTFEDMLIDAKVAVALLLDVKAE